MIAGFARKSLVALVLLAVVSCSGDDNNADSEKIPTGAGKTPAVEAKSSFDGSAPSDWPAYGADRGGSGYSPSDEINLGNVSQLVQTWIYRTGEGTNLGWYKFENTPILNAGLLFLSTPLNAVIALNPTTGREIWRYDPNLSRNKARTQGWVSRGVAFWEDSAGDDSSVCHYRVLFGTLDATLLAIDARTGNLCDGFGEAGVVRLNRGVGPVIDGMYAMTSPPAIVGDVIVTGSSIRDNFQVEESFGTVRGFDVRTGEELWAWDPIPRSPDTPGYETRTPEAAEKTGAANAWAPLSGDPERDMVFIPTGSASPDFYGGERPGENLFSSSVVALRASTGEIIWHFQVVHHDIFDYDVASQPSLVTVPRDGRPVDAVAVVTKMGFIYVLDRDTGESLFPVEERPVPASDVPGEEAWATQPFPVLPPPILEATIGVEDAWGLTEESESGCRELIAGTRNEGIFTPPSLEGTLFFPHWAGGINWGGASYDPDRNLLVTAVKRLPSVQQLVPRKADDEGNMQGTPYTSSGGVLYGTNGLPCIAPPWGVLVGVNLESGVIEWRVPVGETPRSRAAPDQELLGASFWGGPITTAGGLVFMAGSKDGHLRAYDTETGAELWKSLLPAGGQATPMSYEVDGKQYVVIAAGGHGSLGTKPGDYFVAFALPDNG
ncbi:MAG: pyrroloquinoline quinone-dependent dehydrogenase [Dehalococcoidia bacterium]|nr:pyrroloquinoline quinone-dependent dehydrogenase [Dehalococcoidia bacterium]